jgi:NAD(P)-dependent dehydrogenase (short-subunit alcohol dehydrogenase family)
VTGHDGPVSPPPGTALVTGGGGAGIGSAICAVLAEQGWAVAVTDTDPQAATAVAGQIRRAGGTATGYRLDVTDPPAIAAVVAAAESELGPVTGLVNSAGRGLIRPLADTTLAQWDDLHAVDLRGAFACCRAVLPGMVARGNGAIVNVGSVQAATPAPGYGAYAAAKAGLVGLTRAVAADYGRHGVRCCVVHPGLVDSAANRELLTALGDPQRWMDTFVRTRQMLPQPVAARDVAEAVAFLLSDAAGRITAAELTVDAGCSVMPYDDLTDRPEAGP